MPGETLQGQRLPSAKDITVQQHLDQGDGSVVLIDPIHSEDGQTLGFVFMKVDAPVFAPDWAALAHARTTS